MCIQVSAIKASKHRNIIPSVALGGSSMEEFGVFIP
jgi:hypothetical protein